MPNWSLKKGFTCHSTREIEKEIEKLKNISNSIGALGITNRYQDLAQKWITTNLRVQGICPLGLPLNPIKHSQSSKVTLPLIRWPESAGHRVHESASPITSLYVLEGHPTMKNTD